MKHYFAPLSPVESLKNEISRYQSEIDDNRTEIARIEKEMITLVARNEILRREIESFSRAVALVEVREVA